MAGYPFGGWVRSALLTAKYEGERDRAAFLGRHIAADPNVVSVIGTADVIVPVPMHRAAEHERGYNQAQVMAEALGQATGRRVASDTLTKPEARESQVKLTGRQRRRNVAGAFELAAHHRIPPRSRIVVFDDTRTTGATVSACAEALAATMPARIDVVSIAVEYTRDQQEEVGLLETTP